MSEELMWIQMRSGITVIRRLLRDEFGSELTDLLPGRIIPVAIDPLPDLTAIVEQELGVVTSYLAPKTRKGAEAKAILRPLLSLDGAATVRTDPPTDSELNRAVKQLRSGADWRKIMPGLALLSVSPVSPGSGAQEIVLRVGRDTNAIPVRRAAPGEEALAYRTMDPFEEFGGKLSEFGKKLGLTQTQGYAVIEHLKLKDDDRAYYCRRTKRGSIRYQGLSARAYELTRNAVAAGLPSF
jgi:hypothetical protein